MITAKEKTALAPMYWLAALMDKDLLAFLAGVSLLILYLVKS